MAPISIIVPCAIDPLGCRSLLEALARQTLQPEEVIIIDSSGVDAESWKSLLYAAPTAKLTSVRLESIAPAMPGKARNMGIMLARAPWIAFLDVMTLPRESWLEEAFQMVRERKITGVWGSTCFEAKGFIAELIRDGVFGVAPRRTLPGSLICRSDVAAVGHFIEWTRAAEDTEWMARASTLRLKIQDGPRGLISYRGMQQSDLTFAIRRWKRNYTAAHQLQHLHFQKLIAWLLLYAMLVTFAFNWNSIVAGWRTESPLYIDHVTKIVSTSPAWGYLLVRGLLIPHRRGVAWNRLVPARFIAVAMVCLILDGVKALVFLKNGPGRSG